ncbi:hypothetical protein CDL15_Pgr012370 [Punica granatum]|uniref:Uncharacterized protein n=1 Tax=Punica granatum TaxID=22663 RepID=A0A218WLS7_PUNGR|nr:hypothetical protein CDL15_Pgr012370 [Punica granatum]
MLYVASGYEERVGEGLECRVTQWDPWKDVRVHEQSVRVSWGADVGLRGSGRGAGWQAGVRALEQTSAREQASVRDV